MSTAFLRACFAAYQLHLKSMAVDSFVLFTALLQPLMIAFIALYILRNRADTELVYVVVGSGMTGIWSVLLFTSVFGVQGERWYGTLELLVASPTPLQLVVVGKVLASVTLSLGSMAVSYALVGALFRSPISVAHPPLFVASLALSVLALAAFGLLLAPLMAVNVEMVGWVNALEYPIFVLGAFLFPLAMLPGWVWPFSYVLSPFWAARALHLTSSGGSLEDVLVSWAALILLGALYILASARLFRVVLHRVRVSATLGMQ